MWKNGNICKTVGGNENGAAEMGNSMENPQKIKIELPGDLSTHFWVFLS